MITRIEIDGFKSFLDFKLDVPPFLALVGPNSSGKSNLLDALALVQRGEWDLDDEDEPEAGLRGRPHEQFHQVAKGTPVSAMRIDVFSFTHNEVGLMTMQNSISAELGEDGTPEEPSVLRDPAPKVGSDRFPWVPSRFLNQEFAWQAVIEERFPRSDVTHSLSGFIKRIFHAEVRTWRLHQPDPAAMRRSWYAGDKGPLNPRGSNLAAVLGRMQERDALDDLILDLAALVPDLVTLEPKLDERTREWSFEVVVDGQGPVPSGLLSDGTLRVIGLLAALHDPDHPGVLLIEEIENGLHPGRLAELLRRMRQRVTDPSDPASLERPLRQVILTTHSPVVVSELFRLSPESLVFLSTAVRVDPEHGRMSRVTLPKPVRSEGEPGTFTSPRQVRKYLSTVEQGP
ncbi:AAA family ATPase [Nonomuraea sp. NPDC046570]|uniref:AAA family ATPase n=1 Tax=Nonomuraea sp. NPDC046570 TaxID=3155255 RepID=UPI0033DBC267